MEENKIRKIRAKKVFYKLFDLLMYTKYYFYLVVFIGGFLIRTLEKNRLCNPLFSVIYSNLYILIIDTNTQSDSLKNFIKKEFNNDKELENEIKNFKEKHREEIRKIGKTRNNLVSHFKSNTNIGRNVGIEEMKDIFDSLENIFILIAKKLKMEEKEVREIRYLFNNLSKKSEEDIKRFIKFIKNSDFSQGIKGYKELIK